MSVKPHIVNYKVIQSGNVIEMIHYSQGYLKGFTKTKSHGSFSEDIVEDVESSIISDLIVDGNSTPAETPREIMIRSSKRAAKNLVRIINSNVNAYGKGVTSKFLTLTFAEHITDLEVANKMFTDFMRRLNYSLLKERRNVIKYTAVWELTKNGRIHYHVIFYNLPFVKIDKLVDIWGHGIAYINVIDNVDNVGVYVAKYMSKPDDRYLSPEYSGKRRYFSSTGLRKPIEITDPVLVIKAIMRILATNIKPRYSYEFQSDELGLITYNSFIIPNLRLWDITYDSPNPC